MNLAFEETTMLYTPPGVFVFPIRDLLSPVRGAVSAEFLSPLFQLFRVDFWIYIYIYIQKSTRKSWKSGERNSAETAPRTGDKRSRIGNTNTPGGVYNMVVSSNARFIRDAHARTPNSALIVNTWKV